MNFTLAACSLVKEVMKSKGLDPDEYFLEFRVLENGAIGMTFLKGSGVMNEEIDGLRLWIDRELQSSGLTVDVSEDQDRRGLLFRAG